MLPLSIELLLVPTQLQKAQLFLFHRMRHGANFIHDLLPTIALQQFLHGADRLGLAKLNRFAKLVQLLLDELSQLVNSPLLNRIILYQPSKRPDVGMDQLGSCLKRF